MKHLIWISLVIAIGLLAFFFLMPQNSSLFSPGGSSDQTSLPSDGAPGAPGDPGQVNPQGASTDPVKDDAALGTVEDQKKVVEQLEQVLKRDDLKPEERRQVEGILADLRQRIGKQ